MDISQAREIIEALANGVNPVTGEVLPKNHCLNDADIVRALCTATEELKKAEKRKNRKLPENAGKPWNEALDNELKDMFFSGKSETELSKYFKRTKGAISSRLERLGLKEKEI